MDERMTPQHVHGWNEPDVIFVGRKLGETHYAGRTGGYGAELYQTAAGAYVLKVIQPSGSRIYTGDSPQAVLHRADYNQNAKSLYDKLGIPHARRLD